MSSLKIVGHTIALRLTGNDREQLISTSQLSPGANIHATMTKQQPPGCIDIQKRRENPSKEGSLTAGIKTKKASRPLVFDMTPALASDRKKPASLLGISYTNDP